VPAATRSPSLQSRRPKSPLPATPRTEASQRIKARALELGFDAVGIAAVTPIEAAERYEAWLAAGRHGEMRWLASPAHRTRRADPARILRDVRSIVSVALCHSPGRDPRRDARIGRIARYAAGEDYHRVMRDRLRMLQRDIMSIVPGSRALWYSDTGAIFERAWAARAGLGWIGKHSGLLSRDVGSWFLLGEVLVDRELDPDLAAGEAPREHCGTCVRCIDVCPTRAITAPYQVDARRCISYLTIEHRGTIAPELRPLIGDWIFGCDLCQEACPWNRFAPEARESRLHARELEGWTLERFLGLDDSEFDRLFDKSPVRRVGRAGFVRNVCIALGNRGEASAVPALVNVLERDPAPLVRAHAAWALGEIARRIAAESASCSVTEIRACLERAVAGDADPEVQGEARAAARLL
jgi:epoxyqueuosine reductase